MLGCVGVEHELPERAFEPREPILQHDKSRAGQFCGGLEIHLPERFAELEVLLWRKRIVPFGTKMVMLNVVFCILAVGHLVERQVRNFRQRVVQLFGDLLFLSLHGGDQGFQLRDFRHQRLRGRLVLLGLGLANLLRGRIPACLRAFKLLNDGAPAFVDRKDAFRLRRKPAARKPAIERRGVLADPLDVVHAAPIPPVWVPPLRSPPR